MRSAKRIFTVLALLLLCLSLLAVSAFAAEEVASGTCGENLTWVLDSEGTLTISGTGPMKNWWAGGSPWNYNGDIKCVNISSGVTTVGDFAFYGCRTLEEIVIPEEVTRIGGAAFWCCEALTEIELPDSLTDCGSAAFAESGLTFNEYEGGSYLGQGSNPYFLLVETDAAITAIHEDTRIIGGGAFSENPVMTGITIPDGVESICGDAFRQCTALKKITLPDSVVRIGDYAFADCPALMSVVLPNALTQTGQDIFAYCDNLQYNKFEVGYYLGTAENPYFMLFKADNVAGMSSVTIHHDTKRIDQAVFKEFYNLSGIVIPDAVEWMGDDLFYGCNSLKTATLSAGMTTIPFRTFFSCNDLTSVVIPASVTDIAVNAFTRCTSLTDVYYAGSRADWEKITIASGNECLTNATIHFALCDEPSITKLESTASGIKVSWGAVEDAAKYRLFVKTSKGWATVGTTAGTSLTYTGAKVGNTYTFTVRCVNAEGTAFTSTYRSAGWKHAYVAQPAVSKLENTASGVKVTWNAVAGAGKYRLFVKTSKGWATVGTTAGTSLTYTGAKSGSTYTFTVRCLNDEGTAFTSTYNTVGWRQTYVAQPGFSKIESTANGIKLTWNAVKGAGKYRVYVKTSKGWTNLCTTTGTGYTYTNVTQGSAYTFTIRALNSAGTAFVSSYNTAGWKHSYVAQPGITKLENVASGVKITWNKVSGAEQYRLFVKTSKGWATVGTTTGNSLVYTGAESGSTYTFTVRCVNAAGTAFTSTFNSAGWKQTYIAQPEITKMTNTFSGINITWGEVNGAARYRVYVKTASGWSCIGNTTGTSFTWTGAEPGEPYTFTVRCVNAKNTAFTSSFNASGWSTSLNDIYDEENTEPGWGDIV